MRFYDYGGGNHMEQQWTARGVDVPCWVLDDLPWTKARLTIKVFDSLKRCSVKKNWPEDVSWFSVLAIFCQDKYMVWAN